MKTAHASAAMRTVTAAVGALVLCGGVQAAVVIAATRVIYPAKETEVTLRLSNEGASPALVQVWTDDGNAEAGPAAKGAPFLVTPPVSRIDPTRSQTLRIAYTGEPLPSDRESVFWLNMLEVPPRPEGAMADANKLQLAFRSRIKLFFRPSGLAGKAEGAPAQAVWRLVGREGAPALEVRNPTPYHLNLVSVELESEGKRAGFDDGVMVAPGETRELPLKGSLDGRAAADLQLRYQTLNDYGGAVQGNAVLPKGAAR